MTELLILIFAGFGAGVINTIAGGGTFLTFPALVFIGIPPVAANATSAAAVLPGYLGGAIGFRKELQELDRKLLLRMTLIALAGSVVGAALLLVSSNETFSLLVPFLLLAATSAFLFGDQLRKWAASKAKSVTPYGGFGLFAVCVYGGYFNGGLGIVLLALFAIWGMTDIYLMNGLKSWLSFVLSLVSVVVFTAAGLVAWQQAIIMMVAATAGGYAGAPLARALPRSAVRATVAAIGFGTSIVFFARLF